MGWRDKFLKLLAKGEAPEPDPVAWVELMTVSQFEAPVVVHELEGHDIEVTQQESFDLVTKTLQNVTLLVRRSQLAAAQALTASA